MFELLQAGFGAVFSPYIFILITLGVAVGIVYDARSLQRHDLPSADAVWLWRDRGRCNDGQRAGGIGP